MKILFFFCDMLRPDKVENGAVYKIFSRLGGTWYTSAYTPAPETPRAMACFYTGLYPAENGCTKRGQWPYYFMDAEKNNIFKFLASEGYKNYYYASPYSFSPKEGIVPSGFDRYAEIVFDYKTLIDKAGNDRSDDLCVYAGFDDYHDAVDIYSCGSVVSHDEADAVGQEHLFRCMDMLLDAVGNDFFDKIVIFSDHGCMLKGDHVRNGDRFAYVSPIRTNITLFIHNRGDKQVDKVQNICSLLDIFPTVAQWHGKKVDTDGVPLQDLSVRRELVVEDIYHYRGVDNFIYSTYDIWAYISDRFYYTETLEGKQCLMIRNDGGWIAAVPEDFKSDIEHFRKLLSEKCCFYNANVGGYRIISEKSAAAGNELLFRTDAAWGTKYNSSGRRIVYTDGSGFSKTAKMRISRKLGDVGYQWQRIVGMMRREFRELFKLFF